MSPRRLLSVAVSSALAVVVLTAADHVRVKRPDRPAPAREEPSSFIKLPGAGSGAKSFADIASYTATFEPAQAKRGQVVTLKLTVSPKPEKRSWTYPADPPPDQASKNTINVPRKGDVIFVGAVVDPAGWKEKPSDLGGIERYYPKPVTWEIKAVVSPTAAPGKKSVALTGTRFQACIDGNCFVSDIRRPPAAELEILDGAAEKVPAEFDAAVQKAIGTAPPAAAPVPPVAPPGGPDPARGAPPAVAPPGASAVQVAPAAEDKKGGLIQKPSVPPADYEKDLDELAAKIDRPPPLPLQGGFLGLILAAVFWGYVSLVTPCVFPMIPITVSLFLKQSHQSTGGAVRRALVYCLTIIAVLGSSAVFLLSIFRGLSVNPIMNIFMGGLFIVFALSLFGMYDIQLPGFLLRYTEKRRGAGGLIGTVFGALAFSIVSFTCVAPFLGGFAGMAASGNYGTFELILAGIAFATAFASPFFVLAMFPSLIKKLPKSGGWLDSVKVVMGFLELAAAFKFFRTAELRILSRPEYFTYDLVLGAWVAIAAAAGLYLLNLYRLPHDEEKPNVGVFRMLLGVTFLGIAVYLTPALFKTGAAGQTQRPGGAMYAWVNAFLLPEPGEAGGEELPWSSDLKGAVERIVKEKQAGGPVTKPLIFIDFTGVTCSNCKLNEQNVFTQSMVRELVKKYTLVQMYTDDVPATFFTDDRELFERRIEGANNLQFQGKVFGTQQLPLYAILAPQADGRVKVVGVYDEGKINNVPAFVEFLKKPLEGK
ncbi:protein-disulfide reductase DsbD family protein [Fimbriiglobus ruber]|uniref:Cytochrome c-type biogenesis protein DsbD, protein-disulfide reductase n=1 Tax=Fimbriiglobus ruber TaxID=1908690 RepID=A0A225DYK7_9BACT|nr:cytochrome c biogenesis protein CcdA [Fimbriiglobus ruber]OWK42339.1 Cytochrome c-type biogenesis protein DsbD, protein-disulfide reductase [Fimbriiglobus ruber]